jgi:predicted metal-dependent hydrolase
VSKKSPKIAALIESFAGRDLPAHYLGYFDCFNRGLYYEAHDVLEELWLAQGRAGSNHHFYKGLIQLAGAFVHLQKNRLKPSAALFNLAEANLRKYPALHEHLDVAAVLALINSWRGKLESSQFLVNPLAADNAPRITLITRDAHSD